MLDARPWIRALRPGAPVRLLCLSYAGGGSADFRALADGLLPEIDLCPVVLPGRESRLGERAHDDLGQLLEVMIPALLPVFRLAPFAIYGHSMGAWVAFELARAQRRAGRSLPVHLFLGARRAPHRPARLAALSGLPEPAFVAGVQERYGGIPDVIRSNAEMMRLFLPTLRADFQLLDGYRYVDEPPLDVPITVLAGAEDTMEQPADLRAWSEHTTARFALHTLTGGHFFLRESRDDLTERINVALRPFVAADRRA